LTFISLYRELKKGKKVLTLLQCCFDINDYQTKERELKSLVKASKVLSCHDLKVITFDYQNEEKIENKEIKFIPLWKWLLDIKAGFPTNTSFQYQI